LIEALEILFLISFLLQVSLRFVLFVFFKRVPFLVELLQILGQPFCQI